MSTGARTNVGDNSPSLMRVTLRAPPSKWAIEAFFPESPCRVLSLVLSFASKESTTPSGRQPHHSRRSRRVKPPHSQQTFRSAERTCGRIGAFLHSLPPFHSKHAIELLTSFRTSRNASRPTHKTSQNFLPLSNQKSREPHVFHETPHFLLYPRQG